MSFLYVIGLSAFTAIGVEIISGTNNIRFSEVLLNKGNDYNNSTGVFTCRIPVTASAAFHLSVNDTIQVGNCGNPGRIWPNRATYFTGILVKPDA